MSRNGNFIHPHASLFIPMQFQKGVIILQLSTTPFIPMQFQKGFITLKLSTTPFIPMQFRKMSYYSAGFQDPIHPHANSERGDYSTDFHDPGLLRKINGLLFQDIELWMQSLRILVHFHANLPLNCHLIKIHSITIACPKQLCILRISLY